MSPCGRGLRRNRSRPRVWPVPQGLLWSVGPAAAIPVEYVVRWPVADAGPAAIEDVLEVLALSPKGETASFVVRYFEADLPADAPPDANVIVRERTRDGQPEVTWTYRSSQPLAATTLRCPLKGDRARARYEVELAAAGTGLHRTHSWSCTKPGKAMDLIPAQLRPAALGGEVRMLRRETTGRTCRIEEWRYADDAALLEVAWKATDSQGDQQQFLHRVARPLLDLVTPSGPARAYGRAASDQVPASARG